MLIKADLARVCLPRASCSGATVDSQVRPGSALRVHSVGSSSGVHANQEVQLRGPWLLVTPITFWCWDFTSTHSFLGWTVTGRKQDVPALSSCCFVHAAFQKVVTPAR